MCVTESDFLNFQLFYELWLECFVYTAVSKSKLARCCMPENKEIVVIRDKC